MGWFNDDSDEAQSYDQVCQGHMYLSLRVEYAACHSPRFLVLPQIQSIKDDENKPTLSHEVIGGAAAFEVSDPLPPARVSREPVVSSARRSHRP